MRVKKKKSITRKIINVISPQFPHFVLLTHFRQNVFYYNKEKKLWCQIKKYRNIKLVTFHAALNVRKKFKVGGKRINSLRSLANVRSDASPRNEAGGQHPVFLIRVEKRSCAKRGNNIAWMHRCSHAMFSHQTGYPIKIPNDENKLTPLKIAGPRSGSFPVRTVQRTWRTRRMHPEVFLSMWRYNACQLCVSSSRESYLSPARS